MRLVRRGSTGNLWHAYTRQVQSGELGHVMETKERTTKDLVATLTTQNHLHTHSLDLATEEVHGRASADRRNVVRLQVVDHIGDRVEALLNGEDVFVVDCAEVVSGLAGGEKIRGVLETDGE